MATNTSDLTTPQDIVEPKDSEGYKIARVLKELGVRSRADLVRQEAGKTKGRFDKRAGLQGISGIGPVRLKKLNKALQSQQEWFDLFGTLLPWDNPVGSEPVSDVVYHECGAPLERLRGRFGKALEQEVTLYYPVGPDGKPYDFPTDLLIQCPNCQGYLYANSLDVVPSGEPAPEPVDPAETPALVAAIAASGGGEDTTTHVNPHNPDNPEEEPEPANPQG